MLCEVMPNPRYQSASTPYTAPAIRALLQVMPPVTCSRSSSVRLSNCDTFEVAFVLHMIFSIQASADHPVAGAATLAQHSRRYCEPVHHRRRNQTFCDGHHTDAVLS